MSKGESLRDTALTLRAAGADALIIRHPASGAPQQLAEWTAAGTDGAGPTVINAGDGTHEHPTQALLDALTIRQRLGDIDGKRVVIVGDVLHSRVARSNVLLLNTLGAEVVLVAPPTLLPAGVQGWPVTVSHDLDAELPLADAVLMLRVQAERMNGGFFPSAREYSALYGLSEKRQAMLFSATMPDPIITLARTFMTQPTHIRAEAPHSAAIHDTTEQFVYRAHALDKVELISRVLQAEGRGATMIFTRTKRTAQKVADELAERGFSVGAVHGDLGQGAREKALKAFRTGEIDVLVATDVSARGIDIDDVTHVINYQIPED